MEDPFKKPPLWKKLRTQTPVNIGDYKFSAMKPGVAIPDDSDILGRIAGATETVRDQLQLDKGFEKNIFIGNGSGASVYSQEEKGSRKARLSIGTENFRYSLPDDQLQGVILHEAEHFRNMDFLTIEMARRLTDFKPNSSQFIADYRENPDAVINDLVASRSPRRLHKKLDGYAESLRACQPKLEKAIAACQDHPMLEYLLKSAEDKPYVVSYNVITAVMHDMEGERQLYRELEEGSLKTCSIPQLPDPFEKFSKKRKNNEQAESQTQADPQLAKELKLKLDEIVTLNDELTRISAPLFNTGISLQWAEELRCDRTAARYNEKDTGTSERFPEMRGKEESPFSVPDYLRQICDGGDEGYISHPGQITREKEAVQAAAGRYAEDLMAAGAPEPDAMEIAKQRILKEAKENDITPPEAVHPVSSPETCAAKRNFQERLRQQRDRPPSSTRGC